MDPSRSSIQEPPHSPPVSLESLREQISKLEDGLKGREYALSGRILHLTHYLPVVATLNSLPAPSANGSSQPPSDTHTEPVPQSLPSRIASTLSNAASSIKDTIVPASSTWTIDNRRGHTAMVSGIKSLSSTHEQIVIGWTGPVGKTPSTEEGVTEEEETETVVSPAQAEALTSELEAFDERDGQGRVRNVPVWLDKEVAKGHYEGYCKTTLWPLFHYLLWQDVASEYPLEDPNFRPYYEANKAFAERVAAVHKPGDLIFVHDYHLLLAPQMIRELIPEANIALFIHAPFPSSEIFRCLPKRKEILDGMLGANLVCFQTYSYSRHFISTCIRVCGYETSTDGVDANGTVTAVSYCPIGIDCERVTQDRDGAGVGPKVDALRALYAGKKIIVGREKLDVSKGVVEKLQAFEKLLECYPEWRGKVVLIQVTQPSLSDSPKLERTVSELVSHINGQYGSLDFTPVHHYHQTIARDEYFALLSVADLALITALRDGMNTTSMEFTICQDKTSKAPIVLSEFMGTASSFGNAPLLINPHDVLGVAAAINQGLTMNQAEREERHAEIYKHVTSHTSGCWAASVVKLLLENIGGEHSAHETPFLDKQAMKEKYTSAKKRLLLFDYDGTLTPIVKVPSEATPTKRTLAAISKLAEDPRNIVYLISGRDGDFLDEHWGHVKSLGLSAEHGCFLRPPGGEGWKGLTDKLDMSWMSEVQDIFQYYTERTSGSHIELKKASVTWHYRQSDPDFGSFQCKQCHDLLESTLATRRPIEVLVGKKNLEVRPLAINKGEIVKSIIYQHPEAEFIFCAGDDKTDEDMFRALRHVPALETMGAPIAITSTCTADEIAALPEVKVAVQPEGIFSTAVGPPTKLTLARYHVTTPEEIVDMMETLL